MKSATDTTTERWVGRPWAARSVRALVYLVPFVASVAVAFVLGRVVPRAPTMLLSIVRFAGIAFVSTLALIAVDRVTRRLLPLAALLDLTLLFPDQAPSRYKVALRAASATQLQKLLDEYQSMGADEPARAAERLLELVGALRDHDRLTRGHSERVRAYSQMIGEEMGLSGVELDRLRWGGLVHDIGKLRIDPAILNKPGKLTAEEFETIKLHPGFGAVLAAPLAGWLGDGVLAVSQHHERWDGRGYPVGLAGHDIALSARIVSVADTFDVMTSVRSYKAARTAVEAREELARCAGSQFDPAVVRAFLSLSLGKLRVAMGPMSWLAQLAMFPKSLLATAAAPAANAVAALTGVAAATVGAVASADTPRDATPARRGQAAVVTTTTAPTGVGDPVVILPVNADGDVPNIGAESGRGDDGPTTTVAGEPQEDRAVVPAGTSTTTTVRAGSTGTTPRDGGDVSTTVRAPTSSNAVPIGTATTTTAPRSTTTTVRPATTAAPTPVITTTATTTTTTVAPTTTTATTTTTAPATTTTVPPRLTGTWLLGSSAAGNVASQTVLPLAARSALNGGLPNFDTDRDSTAGLLIRKGGALAVGDPTRLQRFRLAVPSSVRVEGNASVRLYAAPVGFLLDSMSVTVALVECTGATFDECTVLRSVSKGFTGLLSTYQAVDLSLGAISETIADGNTVELWVVVAASSSRDMNLAYDTTGSLSTLTLA